MNLLPSVYLVRNNVLLGFESRRLEFLTGFALILTSFIPLEPRFVA